MQGFTLILLGVIMIYLELIKLLERLCLRQNGTLRIELSLRKTTAEEFRG
jgi:hypothetical protein